MIKISVTKLETSRFVTIQQLQGKTFTISIVDWYNIFKVTFHFVVIFKHQDKDLVYVLCIRTEVYPKRSIHLSLHSFLSTRVLSMHQKIEVCVICELWLLSDQVISGNVAELKT